MLMVVLSPEAQSHLERYVREIKTALRGHPSIDADEVERDVLGHIDTELSGQPEPIGTSRLLPVLNRLGAPVEWLPVDDQPAWRRPVEAFRSGPGDWRLPSVTLAIFLAGPVLFMGRMMLWPLPPLLFGLSFLSARVTLALFAAHDEQLGVRRWLVYPALIVWYGAFIVALAGGPVLLTAIFVADDPVFRTRLTGWFGEPASIGILCSIGVLLGIWWMVLGLLLGQFPRGVHAVFRPFADWFERGHAVRVVLLGVGVFGLSGAMLALLTWS